jgi:hypothetical protein
MGERRQMVLTAPTIVEGGVLAIANDSFKR